MFKHLLYTLTCISFSFFAWADQASTILSSKDQKMGDLLLLSATIGENHQTGKQRLEEIRLHMQAYEQTCNPGLLKKDRAWVESIIGPRSEKRTIDYLDTIAKAAKIYNAKHPPQPYQQEDPTPPTLGGNAGSLPSSSWWWSLLGLGRIITQIKRILVWSAFL